jgi:hypothetical protein
MEKLEIILSLSGTGLGLLITAVTFMAKFIKNSKAKKAAESVVEIGNAVLPYIKQAETFINYSGAEKKEYVITKANQFALEHGIRFDAASVAVKVEELVKLTKEVNKREKDNQISDVKSVVVQNGAVQTAAEQSAVVQPAAHGFQTFKPF